MAQRTMRIVAQTERSCEVIFESLPKVVTLYRNEGFFSHVFPG